MDRYLKDDRIVLTLDAGGTNMVFSAMRGCREITEPIRIDSCTTDAVKCLENIAAGFLRAMERIPERPAAASFAFPGPADYRSGIIGDLPNFPGFRGGVALGPYLQDRLGIPVFINNDGNLFACGEALAGALPDINRRLREAGSSRRFRNLIGVTLGTGFGAGVVIDGRLLTGDNDCGGDVWCFRNPFDRNLIVEENVSIRAVESVYASLAGTAAKLSPKEIFLIAENAMPGNREAALEAFRRLGTAAGDALAHAVTLIDGLVVIGGGLSGAARYYMPALIEEMSRELSTRSGASFPGMQMKVFDLDTTEGFAAFARDDSRMISVPGSGRSVRYDSFKRTGIITAKGPTSRSIAAGAYIYAINHLP